MNRPLTREQQREAHSHRAAARSQGQDREFARQQQAPHYTDSIQDLREGGSTTLEESPHRKEHQPQPQGNLSGVTDNYQDWLLAPELGDIQRLLVPLTPQPNPEPPHTTTHSQGEDTMTTHSITQTRHSVDTRPSAMWSQNLVNPLEGLKMLAR